MYLNKTKTRLITQLLERSSLNRKMQNVREQWLEALGWTNAERLHPQKFPKAIQKTWPMTKLIKRLRRHTRRTLSHHTRRNLSHHTQHTLSLHRRHTPNRSSRRTKAASHGSRYAQNIQSRHTWCTCYRKVRHACKEKHSPKNKDCNHTTVYVPKARATSLINCQARRIRLDLQNTIALCKQHARMGIQTKPVRWFNNKEISFKSE